MEEIGADGYRMRLAEILGKAEAAMALLETLPGEPISALVGRTARGQIDGDASCRIRVHTDRSSAEIAARLVEAGYAEPAFGSVESRFGRLEQVIVDDDGVEVRITRCPSAMRVPDGEDLRSGAKIPSLDAAGLRKTIAALAR